MKKIDLKYGKNIISFNIDDKNYCDTINPNKIEIDLVDEEEIRRALENPISSKRLKDIVEKNEKIVIITSDITRPLPSYKILPLVIAELRAGGIREEDITIVLALGSHRKHTEAEKENLVGSAVYNSKVAVIDSDMNKCVNLGICKNGTLVDIFEPVVHADKRICLGNIEYHYFAGYSGGSKAIMPGVSSWRAIQANHANMTKAGAYAGNLESNPVRQDIDQISEFISIDFIVNVVLDDKKRVIKAVAGHWKDSHREGCRVLDSMYLKEIAEKADIVVLSPGGYPKDINIYQAQKGLDNAQHAVRDGGIIVWCASASEGFGEGNFEIWMKTKTPKEMIEEIKENFILGGHKAAAIAMVLEKCQVYMVSDLAESLVRSINLVPFNSVQEAVDKAILSLGENSSVIIMPYAGSTLPRYKGKS